MAAILGEQSSSSPGQRGADGIRGSDPDDAAALRRAHPSVGKDACPAPAHGADAGSPNRSAQINSTLGSEAATRVRSASARLQDSIEASAQLDATLAALAHLDAVLDSHLDRDDCDPGPLPPPGDPRRPAPPTPGSTSCTPSPPSPLVERGGAGGSRSASAPQRPPPPALDNPSLAMSHCLPSSTGGIGDEHGTPTIPEAPPRRPPPPPLRRGSQLRRSWPKDPARGKRKRRLRYHDRYAQTAVKREIFQEKCALNKCLFPRATGSCLAIYYLL